MSDISQIFEEAEDCEWDILVSGFELVDIGGLIWLRRQGAWGPLGRLINFQMNETIMKLSNVFVDFSISSFSFSFICRIGGSA